MSDVNAFSLRHSTIKRDKNKFYFDDFVNDDKIEYKRKYQNDWSELREFVDLNDIELVDNELVIINMSEYKMSVYETKHTQAKYIANYNVIRMMSGMVGIAY
jgi:hypothetical protein